MAQGGSDFLLSVVVNPCEAMSVRHVMIAVGAQLVLSETFPTLSPSPSASCPGGGLATCIYHCLEAPVFTSCVQACSTMCQEGSSCIGDDDGDDLQTCVHGCEDRSECHGNCFDGWFETWCEVSHENEEEEDGEDNGAGEESTDSRRRS